MLPKEIGTGTQSVGDSWAAPFALRRHTLTEAICFAVAASAIPAPSPAFPTLFPRALHAEYDNCYAPETDPNPRARYTAMRDALKRTGRDIVYSLCSWGVGLPWQWGDEVGMRVGSLVSSTNRV